MGRDFNVFTIELKMKAANLASHEGWEGERWRERMQLTVPTARQVLGEMNIGKGIAEGRPCVGSQLLH